MDLSRVANLTDVARRVASAYGALDERWVRAHLTGLLNRIGMTVGLAGPAITVAARPPIPDSDAAEAVVLRLLDLPSELWERDRTPTLVVFDEFQDLLVARRDLDGLLRSRIQYHGDAAAYVYAGSEPSMMRELFDARERPLFGQADPVVLGPLPVGDVAEALTARFAEEDLDPGDALSELVVFAGGHPQRTMLLAYVLAERLSAGAEPTALTARQVVDDALERTAPAHQATWAQLDRSERAVLAAVADGGAPTSRALAADHRLARRTLALAADRLTDQGHLTRPASGSRVVDPLLAEWLRRR